jgi:hypothetical protein
MGISELRENLEKILGLQSHAGKILGTKNLIFSSGDVSIAFFGCDIRMIIRFAEVKVI